tara:strand:+ start:936 stop:1130 length:195 start_codon:yes stop_codon:yes gene_type:complete
MFIKTVEICDSLNSICITYGDEEYVYLHNLETDVIAPLLDYSSFGDNGIRLITEENEYEITFTN